MEGGALVPSRDHPVCSQCGGQCASDHKAEVAWACAGNETGVGAGHQRVDDSSRVLAVLRQRSTERSSYVGSVYPGGHRSVIESAEERQCVLRGSRKTGSAITHGENPRTRAG